MPPVWQSRGVSYMTMTDRERTKESADFREPQIDAAKFAQKLRGMMFFDPNTPTDEIVKKTLEAAGIEDNE